MLVRELMTPAPITIEPDAPVVEALDRMVDEGIRHLPVIDSRGLLVGVVSIDDLAAALPIAVSLHKHPDEADRIATFPTRVGDTMTFGPDTIAPDAPADEAARRMGLKGIGCLPVVPCLVRHSAAAALARSSGSGSAR